jgi:hypothetical protein
MGVASPTCCSCRRQRCERADGQPLLSLTDLRFRVFRRLPTSGASGLERIGQLVERPNCPDETVVHREAHGAVSVVAHQHLHRNSKAHCSPPLGAPRGGGILFSEAADKRQPLWHIALPVSSVGIARAWFLRTANEVTGVIRGPFREHGRNICPTTVVVACTRHWTHCMSITERVTRNGPPGPCAAPHQGSAAPRDAPDQGFAFAIARLVGGGGEAVRVCPPLRGQPAHEASRLGPSQWLRMPQRRSSRREPAWLGLWRKPSPRLYAGAPLC